VNKAGFCYFVPMKREAEASDALLEFIQHVGIPSALHTDGSKTQTLGNWKALVKNSTTLKQQKLNQTLLGKTGQKQG